MVQAFGIITFGFFFLSLVLSTVGVLMSIRIARGAGRMDVPNERSSHSLLTPRMGGVSIVMAVAITFGGWVLFVAGEEPLSKGLAHTFIFAFSMFVIGFIDDLKSLSPLFRFLVQIILASVALWTVAPHFPVISIGNRVFPLMGWVPVAVVLVVWMLNLFNFMDGIDGLAGGESALVSSFYFLVFSYYGETGWAVANLVIAGAAIGFLFHNWSPARIFMGDGGSTFLGAFYGMQFVVAHFTTPVPFPVLVLPFTNFVLDTTCTLFWRVLRSERWYQAHRSHYYQRMTNLGLSHQHVTSLELFVVTISCIVASICISATPIVRVALSCIVVAGITCIGIWVDRKEGVLKRERN